MRVACTADQKVRFTCFATQLPHCCHEVAILLLRDQSTRVRGSRMPFHRNVDFLDDLIVNSRNADIFLNLVFNNF